VRQTSPKVSRHLAKISALPPYHPLQRCMTLFRVQGSAFTSPLRATFVVYQIRLEPGRNLRTIEAPKGNAAVAFNAPVRVPHGQRGISASVPFTEVLRGVYLLRRRGRGAQASRRRRDHETSDDRGGCTSRTIRWSSTCSVLNRAVIGVQYALQHAQKTTRKSAHGYVATTSRDTPVAIKKGRDASKGKETLHKIADVIRDLRKWRPSSHDFYARQRALGAHRARCR